MTKSPTRIKAYRYGMRAELRCVVFLWMRGYQIIARRMRNGCGEIDLIASRGRQLVFIEVKARQSRDAGLYALAPKQQQRIARAANMWLAEHTKYAGRDARFDLMVVQRWRVHHVRHAFEIQ